MVFKFFVKIVFLSFWCLLKMVRLLFVFLFWSFFNKVEVKSVVLVVLLRIKLLSFVSDNFYWFEIESVIL